MKLARFDHALKMVRTYLADCADREDWGDPRAAELTELIRGCVECISVNRRGHGQGGDARGGRRRCATPSDTSMNVRHERTRMT